MRRILLVEDDDDIRESLSEMLIDSYSVKTARNGVEALTALREGFAADGILLDLAMPGMDGGRFRVEQLKDPNLARIPVVLMTGSRDLVDPKSTTGVAAILSKPFETPQLIETLETVLSK